LLISPEIVVRGIWNHDRMADAAGIAATSASE
jgi:hypothetical protein